MFDAPLLLAAHFLFIGKRIAGQAGPLEAHGANLKHCLTSLQGHREAIGLRAFDMNLISNDASVPSKNSY